MDVSLIGTRKREEDRTIRHDSYVRKETERRAFDALAITIDSITATATAPTQVVLSWIPVTGATSYEIFRRSAGSSFGLLTPSTWGKGHGIGVYHRLSTPGRANHPVVSVPRRFCAFKRLLSVTSSELPPEPR
jgi:hypothetical protein